MWISLTWRSLHCGKRSSQAEERLESHECGWCLDVDESKNERRTACSRLEELVADDDVDEQDRKTSIYAHITTSSDRGAAIYFIVMPLDNLAVDQVPSVNEVPLFACGDLA